MTLAALAILAGFALLVWSADRFVEGAASAARHAGMPTLVIGMVVVGFGTSAPELVISTIAALDGNPGLALGNALGSNSVNIGLILGITALIAPIAVQSNVVRRELPVLLLISALTGGLLWDGALSRAESLAMLAGFVALMGWTIATGMRQRGDTLETEVDQELAARLMPLRRALLWLGVGLALLIASSRLLVWGAVTVAQALGVSDLIIGLTVVALGTSLPELASSVIAARKGEHELAIGNIVGSNMFNLLAVIGLAGTITPMSDLGAEIMTRDWPVMMGLTVALFATAYGFRRPGRINRVEGALLLTAYLTYTGYLVVSATGAA